jgi:large subunit ribosomal protein L32
MPVPKRKTSKARRDKRSANKHIRPQAITVCSHCEHALSPHQACQHCGFYKGKKVLITKLDRALKRGETARSKQARKVQAEHDHGDHDHEK